VSVPTTKKPEIDYGVLLNSLILTCKEDGLQPVESFLDKCIQLYDTTVVRHGLMLVGPAGGGKTCAIRTLQKAMTRLRSLPGFARVNVHTLNPKAITLDQLYGFSDPYSNEWTDGTLAEIIRGCIEAGGREEKKKEKEFVVFDGPVDALWIENMNTVLDDNKKLCLVSGEILQLTPHMTICFEVEVSGKEKKKKKKEAMGVAVCDACFSLAFCFVRACVCRILPLRLPPPFRGAAWCTASRRV
jgi:dynein heavy chain